MSMRLQMFFWVGVVIFFVGFLILFKSILLPFVLGLGIAYFLNPLIQNLHSGKMTRQIAVLFVLSVFILGVLLLLGILIPVLYRELSDLMANIPQYAEFTAEKFKALTRPLQIWADQNNVETFDLKTLLQDNASGAVGVAQGTLLGIIKGGQALVSFVTVLLITPIVAYFCMNEWPRITQWSEDIMPRDHKNTIMNLLEEIDTKLAGFVRGQIIVAFLLGAGYAIALTIAGLKYGFIIGIVAGILSIIPMVGSTVGLLTGVLVAWFQAGSLAYVGIIAAIFLIGQLIEGNILAPKIVGDNVGLHPLWVFFALMAGGSLFGIVGMLVAVPVAAIISVLLAFAIAQYKKSAFYKKTPAKKPSKKKKA